MLRRHKILILTVALFLLLFPFASVYLIPGPYISHRVEVEFNGEVKDGLTASTGSEEFREYFIENVSAMASEFPEVERLTASGDLYWAYNRSTVEIGWTNELTLEEKEEVGERVAEAISDQWYTKTAEYQPIAVERNLGLPGAILVVCWFTLACFLVWYWRKIGRKKA